MPVENQAVLRSRKFPNHYKLFGSYKLGRYSVFSRISVHFDGSITLENLIKEKEEILTNFPEATNFKIESKIYDYEQGYSYLIFSFEREETEDEKENRLNAEDRESRIRVMKFKREQEALKKLGLI